MVYPSLGMLAGIWLITSAFMRLEPGARAAVAVAVGLAALILSPLSYWSPTARRSLAALGVIVGLANIALGGPIHAEATWVGPMVLLLVAGISLKPHTVATT
jgi:hypothetical protein